MTEPPIIYRRLNEDEIRAVFIKIGVQFSSRRDTEAAADLSAALVKQTFKVNNLKLKSYGEVPPESES